MKKVILVSALIVSSMMLTACGESKEDKFARLTSECAQEVSKNPFAGMQSKPCVELNKL